MIAPGIRGRKLALLALLRSRPTPEELELRLAAWTASELVDPLIAALYQTDEELHWRAVTGLGLVTARLAEEDMEAGRVVVRRLMWSLNEESGGIGWGAPEAMGEILARHGGLATEYRHILLSYLRQDGPLRWQHGNFLEHEGLQRGLLWAVARLRQARPELVTAADIGDEVAAMLLSPDGTVRGQAVRCLGLLGDLRCRHLLEELLSDNSALAIWQESRLRLWSVAALAREALNRLSGAGAAAAGGQP